MKEFIVTGFSIHGVWSSVKVKTVAELVEHRAKEKGLTIITSISEV